MSDQWIDAWLGTPRFDRYVSHCAGDRALALELYEWNVSLGQSLMRDIAHFEVALRNVYDQAFGSRWKGPDHWLLDPTSPVVMPIWRVRKDKFGLKRGSDVNYLNRRSVDSAIQKCGGVSATPGRVMAELGFGFWSHLTTASHEKSIWVPYLHHAYPTPTTRSDVDKVITNINIVRNRIAHHEPVFERARTPEREPARLHGELVRILRMIAPHVAAHIEPTSTVANVIAVKPQLPM